MKATKEMKKTIVRATYVELITFMNVMVNIPGTNDKHRKFISDHEIVVDGNPDPIFIPAHFRRGDIIDGQFVTRHIYLDGTFPGKFQEEKSMKMVANVTLVEKTDHNHGDKKSLIIDIHLIPECLNLTKAEWDLAIGTSTGDLPIPNTSKFIAFKSRLKN